MERQLKLPWLFICAAAALAGIWLFNPSSLYFLNDDFIHIPLSKDFILFQRKSFRPVGDLSVAFDYFLWNKNPWGYHLSNVVLHVINTVLVYILASAVYRRGNDETNNLISILTAVLFFIYPFHSESIYWIIGRSGSLGTLFFLPAIIFYLKRNDKAAYFILSCFFFCLGLITYESVWVFPVIAIGVSWLDRHNNISFRREVRYVIVLTVIFILFLVIRYAILGEIAGEYEFAAFKKWQYAQIASNFLRLFARSFIPPVASNASVLTAIIVLAAFASFLLVLMKRKKQPYNICIFAFVCFVISILPYLSLGIDTHGVESERFLYLPSIFICLLTVHLIFKLFISRRVQLAAVMSLYIYCGVHLYNSRKIYTIAGNVSKAAMQEVTKIDRGRKIAVENLPQEHKGSVIFRLGFKEGVEWMTGRAAETITIHSTEDENTTFKKEYKVVYTPTGTNRVDSSSNVLFHFTDTALFVYK
jgi:hypothetical protein